MISSSLPHLVIISVVSLRIGVGALVKDGYVSVCVYYFKDALVQIAIKTFGHNESEGADLG